MTCGGRAVGQVGADDAAPEDSPCASGEYDADSGPGRECRVLTECSVGSYEAYPPPTAETDRKCAPCESGHWDHDQDFHTACSAWSDCLPGWSAVPGSATTDRACVPCAEGTFADARNSEECVPWTECSVGDAEAQAGSADHDRICQGDGWTRQFGTEWYETIESGFVDGVGALYVVGNADNELPSEVNTITYTGAFVRKYDADGAELWTLGTEGSVSSVAVQADGSMYVAGRVYRIAEADEHEAYLRKYDAHGEELWRRQIGTDKSDSVQALSVDGWGNVVVVGATSGAFPGYTDDDEDLSDAFLRKYDADGTELWTRQFGTEEGDGGNRVVADQAGSVYVAMGTFNGNPGDPEEGSHAYLRKFDATGTLVWTADFPGTEEFVEALAVDASGNVVVGGSVFGALPGQVSSGHGDGFVRKYDALGNELWTRQFSAIGYVNVPSVSIAPNGDVIAGGYFETDLDEHDLITAWDVFVRRFDADGADVAQLEFGSTEDDQVTFVGTDGTGHVFVAGETGGALPGQTAFGSYDCFVVKLAL